MTKKRWFGERKYREDDTRRKEKEEAKKDLRRLAENGTEEDVRKYLKVANPKLTEGELEELLRLFREQYGEPRRR